MMVALAWFQIQNHMVSMLSRWFIISISSKMMICVMITCMSFNLFYKTCNLLYPTCWEIIISYCFSDTGGATFCAVAALQLMGFIGEDISPNQEVIDMPLLVEWLLQVHMKPFVYFLRNLI